MKIIYQITISACLLVIMGSSPLMGSDHLDAPFVTTDGRLDINDSYIFQSPADPSKSVMILTVNPAAGVFSPTTFNPAGVYEFKIDNNGDARADVTFSVTFGPPNSVGRQTFRVRRNRALVARGTTGLNARLRVRGGGTVRCGLFDDPFFFDLNGFNDGFQFTGDDFFAGLNVSGIVIELPTAIVVGGQSNSNVSLNCRTTIGGSQFDRVGRPAINTALIPTQLKDAFNTGIPVNDPRDFGEVVQSSIESLNGGDTATAEVLTGILLPDVLTVDLNSPAGFLNGRQLADDVIDAELSLLTNGAVTGDGVDANDVSFPGVFPYLANPHQN